MDIEVYFILFFLALGLCLFWSLVFKSVQNHTKRKVITILLTLASAPILYVALVILLVFPPTSHPNHDFSRQKWLKEPDIRYELTKDLIDSKILIGKTKAEVVATLGEENGNTADEDLWYYYVGMVSSTGNLDPDILVIQFKNGRVVSARQIST